MPIPRTDAEWAARPEMTPKVYLAARSEDREEALRLRRALIGVSIGCTARWLDVPRLNQPGTLTEESAELCTRDIISADVFVTLSSRRTFRDTTGGKHVELGMALMLRKPILLLGERENVFHYYGQVQVLPELTNAAQLARCITLAHEHGTPIPRALMA